MAQMTSTTTMIRRLKDAKRAAPSSAPTESEAAMLSDEEIRDALFASRLHKVNRTVITRWKDGIDIDFPIPEVVAFARSVERAAYERAAALVVELTEDNATADAIRALGRQHD